MSRTRTIALSVSTLAAAAALTACSSSGDPASSSSPSTGAATTSSNSATPTTPAPATTTTTTTVAAGNGPTSTSGGSSTGSQCAESQLRASAAVVTLSGVQRHVVKLTFLNKSDRTCTLTGYPGAAIEDSSNKQVQQAKRVVGGPVGGTIERSATIPVKPGSSVFAWLEGKSTKEVGAAQAGCDGAKYPRILVTPPNTKIAVPFTVGWPQCYSFDVHPVRSQ